MRIREISLISAILININVMIGAGLFVNPRPLTQLLGGWGFMSYLVGAAILFPLVLCLAELAATNPAAGGLYVYSEKYISPMAGVVSGWAYFTGRATSAAFLTYTFTQFFQQFIPPLANVSTVFLASVVIFFLVTLNIVGVSIGGKIQWLFIVLKALPISFVFLFFLFAPAHHSLVAPTNAIRNFPATLPIAIYAMLGFDIICAVAHLIKNPEKNARRAVIYSFTSVAAVVATFQWVLFRVVGTDLATDWAPIFTYVHHVLPGAFTIAHVLNAVVFASILGGAFGIFTSNCWNLFALAEKDRLPFASLLTRLNKKRMPWISLLVEGGLAVFVLCISSRQVALQNMAVFGMFVSHFLSSLSALKSFRFAQEKTLIGVAILSVATCSGVLLLCLKRLMISGISYSFLFVVLSGFIAAGLKKWPEKKARVRL